MLFSKLTFCFVLTSGIITKYSAPDIFADEDPTNPMRLSRTLASSAAYDGDLTDEYINTGAVNVQRIKKVLSLEQFNYLFHRANLGKGPFKEHGPYYYDNFLKAAAKWPKFCDEVGPFSRYTDADDLCKLELASMFAHFGQEVGEHNSELGEEWRQGLYWYTEVGCAESAFPACSYRSCSPTSWEGKAWPCPDDARYYGRGAKQLSYNYNYGPFSEVVFGDVSVLLNDPDKVITDGWLAFASAFWFYMTPQSPKPSMHDVVSGFWSPNRTDEAGNRFPGFGMLIMIINGGIECTGGPSDVPQAANRIEYFKRFCEHFEIDTGDYLSCQNMAPFDSTSNGAIKAYWDQAWSGEAACRQVAFQTAYNIFTSPRDIDGPYSKCVENFFDDSTDDSTTACNVENCSSCIAVRGNQQGVTDEACSACPSQQWWPCDQKSLCRCPGESSTTDGASTITDVSATTTENKTTTTSQPTSTGAPSSTTTIRPSGDIPCNKDNCSECEAVPGNNHGATDEFCSQCPSYQWWPCNQEGLCRCTKILPTTSSNQSVTEVQTSTTTESKETATDVRPTETSSAVKTTETPYSSSTPMSSTTANPSGCVAPDIFANEDASNPMRLSRVLNSMAPADGYPTEDFISKAQNVDRIKRVLSLEKFNYLFYRANLGKGPFKEHGPYYYENFLKAAAKWPKFCDEVGPHSRYSDADDLCKLELASMFAHFAQEVGEHGPGEQWRQGLYWYTEIGCAEAAFPACAYRGGTCDASTWQGEAWPCPEGARYYGRGAKQLSYNYNYGPFSKVVFGDESVLLNNPDLIITDGWLAFASAFWFYMTPQSPKPSMHDVVVGYWTPNQNDIDGNRLVGFGVLIMIINGGIECGGSYDVAQAANRINYFKGFCREFDLSPGDNLSCANMQAFGANSNGAIKSYWDQGWSGEPECQQFSYQTAYSIFDNPHDIDGPYCKCVEKFYGKDALNRSVSQHHSQTPTPNRPRSNMSCQKSGCTDCVAVKGNNQGVNDDACKVCFTQAWWPCNNDSLCECAN